ncbi:MAG: TonB-dependent receptor [Acidobacteria bacterium]|nr:TonB-dependent receptor [Acidobacteriota bacterium]
MEDEKMKSSDDLSLRILLFVALAIAVATPLVAQLSRATLSGTVTDTSGAIVPGATVIVQNVETNATVRSTITNSAGRYEALNLLPGQYEVRVELTGFRTAVRRGIQLAVEQSAVVDLIIQVGDVVEEVVVTSEAPLVETTTASVSNLVDNQQMRELPLNGRDLTQLALLGPGIAAATNANNATWLGAGIKLTVSGQRPQANSFLFDGTNISSQTMPSSVAGAQLGVDNIREFRVVTHSFNAEYPSAGGGIVIQISKSGTNRFSGSLFEFHRNSFFDARNFFDRGDIPHFTRNQFGATLGGPIQKDKTFFFAGYEGLIERLSLSYVAIVPNDLARQGILPGATGNVGVDPLVRPYLEQFPRANGSDIGDGRALFLSNPVRETDAHNLMSRVDRRFSDKSSFYIRYTLDPADRLLPRPNGQVASDLKTRNHYLIVSHDYVLSGNKLNSFRIAFNRSYTSEFERINFPKELLFNPDAPESPPGIRVTGLERWGTGSVGGPMILGQNILQLADDFSVTTGSHSMKFGAFFDRGFHNERWEFGPGGTYSFQSLRHFLQNSPFTFDIQLPESDLTREMRQSLGGVYFQDDIRLGPGLTLNAGLRWEFFTGPTEVDGEVTALIPMTSPTVTPADVKQVDRLFSSNFTLFSPRVGLAWDPFGNGKTAIRTGFGIFYDQISVAYWRQASLQAYPFNNRASLNARQQAIVLPNWQAMNITSGVSPTLEGFPPDPNAPYLMRWSFLVDREVFRDLGVSIGYVGARGIHLLRHTPVNLIVPTVLADGTLFFPPGQERQPNPNFSSMNFKSSDGVSRYHGLELNVVKRYSRGLRAQFSYAFSKAMDDGASVTGNFDFAGDNAVPRYLFLKDYGLSPYDVRHKAVLNVSYDLPRTNRTGVAAKLLNGWQISNITTLSSGSPFSALRGFVPPGFRAPPNHQSYYPDLVPGRSTNPTLGGPDRYFDPASFVPPTPGFIGNLGRNTLIGPGLAQVDLSLLKKTGIRGTEQPLEFRFEVFNLLNRANFAVPQNSIFNANDTVRSDAGQITSTNTTSRKIQLGVRYSW